MMMNKEAINRAGRRSRKVRTLGPNARCWKCDYTDVTALQWKHGKIWCYECASAEEGRPTVEEHHVLGRTNDPAMVSIPGNLHRALSDAQEDWPKATRYNRDGDQLRRIAAYLRARRDVAAWEIEILEPYAQELETLAEAHCVGAEKEPGGRDETSVGEQL
jgi:hypothetical protein